jgi:glycosyltransferase involved in cell wall biosynthesis
MMRPAISVVTPSFNQSTFLEETIESVLVQNYPNLEYRIFDAGSTDGSVDVIRRYENHLSGWISRRDRGQSDAINQGLRAAKGDILCWINSDDYLCPGALDKVANFFQENPEAQWLIGSCELLNDHAQPHDRRAPPRNLTRKNLMAWWPDHWFCQQATFWRRSLMDKAGLLDESLHYLMDWELWLRFYAVAAPAVIPDNLAGYRLHANAKCLSATNQLSLEELTVHRKIQRSADADLLAQFKPESAERLIKLGNEWLLKSSDLQHVTSKNLFKECRQRVRSKFKQLVCYSPTEAGTKAT